MDTQPNSDLSQSPARAAYSVEEARALLGISRGSIYKLMDGGRLRSVKVGTRRLIPAREIDRFLDESEEA